MRFDDLKSDFEIAPQGVHTAILVSWIDRGLQAGKYAARRQIGTRFELVDIEGDEPTLVFHSIFNLTLRSKGFAEMASALMGSSDFSGHSVREMLGKPCKIVIVHKENGGQVFANIASFSPYKGPPVHADSELIYFSLEPDDTPPMKQLQKDLDSLPESERSKILASETWKQLVAIKTMPKAARVAAAVNDSIPDIPIPADARKN